MRKAIIKDNVVINVINYDEAALLPDIERYKKEKAIYDKEKKKYDEAMIAADEEYSSLIADLAALKIEAKTLGTPVDKTREKNIKQKITKIQLPKAPSSPKNFKGLYTPPDGCVMVDWAEACDIGSKYIDGQFISGDE